jgi:hypothetical protein
MHTDLYSRVSPACCYITVFLGDEKVSAGTGFAFTETGEVLTAAHVVTGRWPIQKVDYQDPSQRIFCKFPNAPFLEYKVVFCCLEIKVSAFTEMIQIDMAVLHPTSPLPSMLPFLPALAKPPSLGEQVFMAGFSDELRLPFDVDRLLKDEVNGAQAFQTAMEKGYMADMTGPLFKRGVVGNIRRVTASSQSQSEQIDCDIMYIDNAMHSGASGGPVFNRRGDAVGIVSQRALTRMNPGSNEMLQIPSGSTVAVSLAPLLYFRSKCSAA